MAQYEQALPGLEVADLTNTHSSQPSWKKEMDRRGVPTNGLYRVRATDTVDSLQPSDLALRGYDVVVCPESLLYVLVAEQWGPEYTTHESVFNLRKSVYNS